MIVSNTACIGSSSTLIALQRGQRSEGGAVTAQDTGGGGAGGGVLRCSRGKRNKLKKAWRLKIPFHTHVHHQRERCLSERLRVVEAILTNQALEKLNYRIWTHLASIRTQWISGVSITIPSCAKLEIDGCFPKLYDSVLQFEGTTTGFSRCQENTVSSPSLLLP